MAERALTGEFSIAADKGDRDHDCVPDIATAGLPAALAAELVIERSDPETRSCRSNEAYTRVCSGCGCALLVGALAVGSSVAAAAATLWRRRGARRRLGRGAAGHRGLLDASRSLSDDGALWVVNPDSDSVSVIDPTTRTLVAEIPLGPAPPAVDPPTQRYEPAVQPRALAIVGRSRRSTSPARRRTSVFVIDAASHKVLTSIPVRRRPAAVAAAPDGERGLRRQPRGGAVTKIDPATDTVVGERSPSASTRGARR